jgi:MerR family transcriptional regulator, copper efflux regulator
MRILQFVERTGLTRDTIRFYEKRRLLCPKIDGSNRYRDYSDADVERVAMIRLGQRFGFTLSQIQIYAQMWESNGLTRKKKLQILSQQRDEIGAEMQRLKVMRDYLNAKLRWIEGGEMGAAPGLKLLTPPASRSALKMSALNPLVKMKPQI